MNITRYLVTTFVVAVAVFTVQASDTYACPVATPTPTPVPTATPCGTTCPTTAPQPTVQPGVNWTSLNMQQKQWFVGNSTNVTMNQKGVGLTATFLGDHAMSSSRHLAEQKLSGAPTKATQSQQIVSGARTEFQANKVPSWTTAGTMGTINQAQNAWSATPINLFQNGATDQRAQIGETKTIVQGQEEQTLNGVTGDPFQTQNIAGSSQAQGFTSLPFPQIFTLGNTFRQVVNFSVDNIFSF